MSEPDCQSSPSVDPSGVPFTELDPELLRAQRTSLKWTRFPADVLPLFVAEMDFAVAPEIREAIIARVEASDTGYLDGPGPLAPAFAEFAAAAWDWHVPTEHVYLATDVATGVVESLRIAWELRRADAAAGGAPASGRIVVPTPVYPGFFEMLEEVPYEIVEVPLREADAAGAEAGAGAASGTGAGAPVPGEGPELRLDLAAIADAFAAGADAFLLCNPHNPHGLVHTAAELGELARLAEQYGVFAVSDEIHAPLTHAGERFVPFAPLAAAAGALAVVATSASKGWNLAGAKCSVIVAADERANAALQHLPPETVTRASILGLHAGVAAFTSGREWLARAIGQIEANTALLAELVAAQLPGVRLVRPRAGYLAWLDFREAGLGEDPYARILTEARVALNDGAFFGAGGAGHVRLNLACAPDTIRAAVSRIAAILPTGKGSR
ncbi:aminotransferase class I/II-fold pyridoxal phosphate-dependent enzyme [Leucobacter luti]|uniref:cysteine-S-conjugate beta-lyase n=1 Tax=Leucobacter luti TaxID=340320 RepID=A0A4Q7TSU9_9MICO|nr:aminotransferase class I/II-fold pyridoxal phosphate-dependent enzyme [Leucobacter luti]MBL3699894.1 aminotransferase class I/II-fold pyridoxal phosphate-dependent enzyme [Leucobacter luti]RZT62788.1 cystathionine beta-lyase [Leucobacter luti]